MIRHIILFAVCAIVFLSACSAPKQAETITTPDAANEDAAMDEAVVNAMDQAFGEMIRSGGAVLPDIEYNGAGKLAAYLREFKDGDDEPSTGGQWDLSFLPDGLAAEKPEDVAAIVVIDMDALVFSRTSDKEKVGKPVEQELRYKVGLYNPQSWRCALYRYFFGEAVPVGSQTIRWNSLPPPDMNEVQAYIQSTLPHYEAIAVSSSWQAFDDAFGAFVDGHYDNFGSMVSNAEEKELRDTFTSSYNGAGKFAACFISHDDRSLYWTDSILPEEIRAGSPEDVSAIVVVERDSGSGITHVDLFPVAGEGARSSGLGLLGEDDYPDFFALLHEIENRVPFILTVEEPAPCIAFVEYTHSLPSNLNVILENISDFDFAILKYRPLDALLERNEGGEWVQVPTIPIDERWGHATEIAAGSREMISLTWTEQYGELTPGEYRIAVNLTCEKLPESRPTIRFEEALELEFTVE